MFRFSIKVYDVLWEVLGLPPMPARIAVAQTGSTLAERSLVRAAALAETQQLGLGQPPEVDQRLIDLLDLLARHTRAVSMREIAGRCRRAYAAASGRYGALGVIEGDEVSIVPIFGDHLASELLRLLVPLPARPGRAVSMPSSIFTAAMQAYDDPIDSSQAHGILRNAGLDAKDIERVLTIGRQTIGSGSIGVHKGERESVKLIDSLGYIDARQGRYAIVERDDQAGQAYISVVPTDLDGLRKRIHKLLEVSVRR
jgi:EspG family